MSKCYQGSVLVNCDIAAIGRCGAHTMSTGACRRHAPIYQ